MSELYSPRRALLSVSDKHGIVALARALAALGVELWSTGGTARHLRAAGLAVIDVSEVTGFAEIMDGRVKTLHPRIHGALLGRDGIDDAVMDEHGIAPIDLLIVNLYPFEATIGRADASVDQGIEAIDIGGPAMLRAAAKNHARVAVAVDPTDYAELLTQLTAGGTTGEQRRALAAKAFAHTAHYDGLIATWLATTALGQIQSPPPTLHLDLVRAQSLRYGENPHQRGALYLHRPRLAGVVANAEVLAGKALSYNNIADADAALECVKRLDEGPACVIVKHANPCGAAIGASLIEAYERALATDPVSAFGGVVACNRALDAATVERILANQFVEVLVAPSIEAAAIEALKAKPNVRALASGPWPQVPPAAIHLAQVAGGLLWQDADALGQTPSDLRVVSKRHPSAAELADLWFAWRIAIQVKSNAIVYARDGRTLGIGAGQMSRVVSARIAALKAAEAQLDLVGCAMASDAFFPFRDGIDAAAAVGVRCVIHPGGSIRDAEVLAAADQHDMALVVTGRRHFRH